MSLVAHKYTPGEMSPQELESTFAARGHTVDYLLKSLRDQIKSGTLSSYVITGPRGAGKSTVIQMVNLRIKQDPELNAAWLPVVFPEEQFDIGSLRDLLVAVLEKLARETASAKTWLEKVENEPNDEQSLQLAITALQEITRKLGKRLILLIENLNQLLEERLDDQMKGTFRRLLMSEPFMMVIGSSVHVFDSLKKYDEAFFNYFGQVPLDRLTAEQVFELLRLRAQFDGNELFLEELPSQQAKVRAIVHLSGGNPRLTLMLYELLTQRQATTIVQCLRRLVDELTPLFKHEIENLPPQQKKIIHALMEKGGTAKPTDLVDPTRLPLNAITTQLGRLKEVQFVEVLGGGKGKTANYTIPDKLFAIWYQMRYLSQNRRRIETFVEVLRVWFEEEERLSILRKLTQGEQKDSMVLRESAPTVEYFAASLKGTHHETLATELCIKHWAGVDLREAALVHADFCNRGPDLNERQAYANLGTWLNEHGDHAHAIQSLDAAISINPNDAFVLYCRGLAKLQVEDFVGAMSDLTAATKQEHVNMGQIALVLPIRATIRERTGDLQGAIVDYSTLIAIGGLDQEQLGSAYFNRGVAKGESGDIQGSIADYSAVAALEGVSEDRRARALLNRGVAKGRLADQNGEIEDYTEVIEIKDVPIEHAVRALMNRGIAKGRNDDPEGEVRDYTKIITNKQAPDEYIAAAHINRGIANGRLGNIYAEIADYNSAIELKDIDEDTRARALLNRGIAKEHQKDVQSTIADYTAVIGLQRAAKELRTRAFLHRGLAKDQLNDRIGAIEDYTAVIESTNATIEEQSIALLNRGLAFLLQDQIDASIDDHLNIIGLQKVDHNLKVDAARIAFGTSWLGDDQTRTRDILLAFLAALASPAQQKVPESVLRFLSSLACPMMKEGWPTAWRILAETEQPEIKEALLFLKPVCEVLEGKDRTLLESLPPEQREFAEKVLLSFEEQSVR